MLFGGLLGFLRDLLAIGTRLAFAFRVEVRTAPGEHHSEGHDGLVPNFLLRVVEHDGHQHFLGLRIRLAVDGSEVGGRGNAVRRVKLDRPDAGGHAFE